MIRHYQLVVDRFGEEKGTVLMRKYRLLLRPGQTRCPALSNARGQGFDHRGISFGGERILPDGGCFGVAINSKVAGFSWSTLLALQSQENGGTLAASRTVGSSATMVDSQQPSEGTTECQSDLESVYSC